MRPTPKPPTHKELETMRTVTTHTVTTTNNVAITSLTHKALAYINSPQYTTTGRTTLISKLVSIDHTSRYTDGNKLGFDYSDALDVLVISGKIKQTRLGKDSKGNIKANTISPIPKPAQTSSTPHIKVYRIEHAKTQYGPYNSHVEISEWAKCEHNEDTGRPGPRAEWGTLTESRGKIFGFQSIKHLTRWFTSSERIALHHLGFKVKTYKVPVHEVLCGKRQVAFTPPNGHKAG